MRTHARYRHIGSGGSCRSRPSRVSRNIRTTVSRSHPAAGRLRARRDCRRKRHALSTPGRSRPPRAGRFWSATCGPVTTATLVPADGVPATGMKHDARSNLLFVARAASGMGTVFDAASGDVVASYQFHAAPTFVNDVVITREAAYFTDTQAPFLYRVALGPAGEPAADFTEIPLPATFRTNGIAATRDGEHLFVIDGPTAQLYRLDTATHTPVPRRSRRRDTAQRGWIVARRQDAVRRAECPQPDRGRRTVARLPVRRGRAIHHGTLHVEPRHEGADHHRRVRRCAVRRDRRLRGARRRTSSCAWRSERPDRASHSAGEPCAESWFGRPVIDHGVVGSRAVFFGVLKRRPPGGLYTTIASSFGASVEPASVEGRPSCPAKSFQSEDHHVQCPEELDGK